MKQTKGRFVPIFFFKKQAEYNFFIRPYLVIKKAVRAIALPNFIQYLKNNSKSLKKSSLCVPHLHILSL